LARTKLGKPLYLFQEIFIKKNWPNLVKYF
jgi:hypothetical protein